MVGEDATVEFHTSFALGLQVKFEHSKMVAFGEDIIGLLAKISIVWWGNHGLENKNIIITTFSKRSITSKATIKAPIIKSQLQ